ncbi:MAG: thioredoxin domain-containing protein [Polyangiaceae bacterium]
MTVPDDTPAPAEPEAPLPTIPAATWSVPVFLLGLALVLAGLVAGSMLLIDYIRPAPVFCDPHGGCAALKRTIFAYPFGIPMPVFGISGFVAMGLAWVTPGRRMQLTQGVVGISAGLMGLGLIGVQLSMKTVCPFCFVTDTSAIVLAALGYVRLSRGIDPPAIAPLRGLGIVAITGAAIVPAAVGASRAPNYEVPDVIRAEMEKTPMGKTTVVDFVDFECPFCRATHEQLKPVLAQTQGRVRVARKHVPLRMHLHAKDAALAACCAEKMGKGDAVAEALFSMPPEQMTPEGCAKAAREAGLDEAAFAECVKDPTTEERIKQDSETFRAADGHGLPTLWIDTVKLEGEQERADLEAAFKKVGAL